MSDLSIIAGAGAIVPAPNGQRGATAGAGGAASDGAGAAHPEQSGLTEEAPSV